MGLFRCNVILTNSIIFYSLKCELLIDELYDQITAWPEYPYPRGVLGAISGAARKDKKENELFSPTRDFCHFSSIFPFGALLYLLTPHKSVGFAIVTMY